MSDVLVLELEDEPIKRGVLVLEERLDLPTVQDAAQGKQGGRFDGPEERGEEQH